MIEPNSTIQSLMTFLAFLPLIPLVILVLYLLITSYMPKEPDSFPWGKYGLRMKIAYAVKFGSVSVEFNKEVDNKILAMQTLGSGHTRQQAEQWLKSHAEFVEIPWKAI